MTEQKEKQVTNNFSPLTLPTLPDIHVSRANYISWLHDRFTTGRKVIVIKGEDGIGKTTLLNEFSRVYKDNSFCFFIGSDIWGSSTHFFLSEMCEQMAKYLEINYNTSDSNLSDSKLEADFRDFYRKIAKQARRNGNKIFFIIDGLDLVNKSFGEKTIIDLLPYDPPEGLYLIVSSNSDLGLNFPYDGLQFQKFSPAETEDFLTRLKVPKPIMHEIYKACDGLPGYLAELARELSSETPLEKVLMDLPKGFKNLLERNWNRLSPNEACLDIFALICFSEIKLDKTQISKILDLNIEGTNELIEKNCFFKQETNNIYIEFVSNAYKKFVEEKVKNRKIKSELSIIKFLETEPHNSDSLKYLPELYRRNNKYEALKNLINCDFFVSTLKSQKDFGLLTKNSKLIAETAFENNDWSTLNIFSIISSILETLSYKSIGAEEIDALISLGDFNDAFSRAYQAVLVEDRLQLLSKICYELKKQNQAIPNNINNDLEELVKELKLSVPKERIIDIAVDLFYINQNLAMELIDIFSKGSNNSLMDIFLTNLSLRLESESDSTLTIKSSIRDQKLRKLALVSSPTIAKLNHLNVIKEIDYVDDESAKLFILRSWCNSNRSDPNSGIVINKAIEIMTSSIEYAPAMRHLRQFCEPLLNCTCSDIFQIINRIDILKNTAIESPIDEKLRLELLISAIEIKFDPNNGLTRLYSAYFELDDITDVDTKAYCITRFLIQLPSICPEDAVLFNELKIRLDREICTLLANSADQFEILKRILRALTLFDVNLAVLYADKLNTALNRNKAYFEILKVYLDKIDVVIPFIIDTISKISDQEIKIWANIYVIKKLVENKNHDTLIKNTAYIEQVKNITDSLGKCITYSYLANFYYDIGDISEAKNLESVLYNDWDNIIIKTDQIDLGFSIISIISEKSPDFSRKIFNRILECKSDSSLSTEIVLEVYLNILKLLIRVFPDILKTKDYKSYEDRLVQSICMIPSISIQIDLFSELALHYYISEKQNDAENIVQTYIIKNLDTNIDTETRNQIIVQIAHILFLYERSLLTKELENLSSSRQHNALLRIYVYLLSKRNPNDPIDIENLNIGDLDFRTSLQLAEVINLMSQDFLVYTSIDRLINKLCKKEYNTNTKRETCVLLEKHALTIAKEVNKAISKLPDLIINIQHYGYKIASQACLLRLKSSFNKNHRAENEWNKIIPSLDQLNNEIENIPNLADKIYVKILFATKIYHFDINSSHKLLEEAGNNIEKIGNLTDRCSRFLALSEAWKEIDDANTCKHYLEKAFLASFSLQSSSTRDDDLSKIIELAHSINPEFASSLTSRLDSLPEKNEYERKLKAKELHNNPTEIQSFKQPELNQEIIERASFNLLKSFCSGRGYTQSDNIVCNWLKICKDLNFQYAYNVYAWSIENNLAANKLISQSQLSVFFNQLHDNLLLIRRIGEVLLNIDQSFIPSTFVLDSHETDLDLFYSNSNLKKTLEKWLAENCGDTVKIYDAYFSASSLSILKVIKPNTRIDIFTLWKSQKGINPGNRNIERLYKEKWEEISDQPPPETHIYIIGTLENGDGPIHDRYIVTNGIGVGIGTSLSGLDNKDSSINYLDEKKATNVETKYIIPLLLGINRVYKGLPIESFHFTL
ncbi:MAG: hypothetical protein CVU39_11815 [Chloroflexi bacterium HGW-Chloroflexi-10]|nr:MAG: hypothetical protein CVU39_11815 [Chloroflexi bacterium HGW-Chloroflexi-10]